MIQKSNDNDDDSTTLLDSLIRRLDDESTNFVNRLNKSFNVEYDPNWIKINPDAEKILKDSI